MAEKSKSEDFVRYVIKPRSDIIVGGVHAYYDLGLAESEAKYWAKETGVYYEILIEKVHSEHLEMIDYYGKMVENPQPKGGD